MLKVLALALAASTGIVNPLQMEESPRPATVDISAIRYLECSGPEGIWVGSGFLIGDHVLATALHVVKDTVCVDAGTGSQLLVFKTDPKHDLALVTSPKLPTDLPYIKINCGKFITGQKYLSWGITPYGRDWESPIIRMNVLTASADYTDPGDKLEDGTPAGGMRYLDGFIAPGMSGAPVTDLAGEAHALNNAGSDTDTVLYEFADGMLCTKA